MKTLLTRIGFGLVGMSLLSGCMDGPFYAMKRVNPFFRSKWQKDREYGPTFEDRVAELRLLESQLPNMPPEKQDKWAQQLESLVRDDTSPEIRSKAVAAIAVVPSVAAERALNTASADDVEKVRLAACKAWQARGGQAARDMLLSLANSDNSNSVRQAAIDALGSFEDPEVMRALGNLLDDNSPAIQLQVAQSLENITGEKYAGDFDAWKEYLAGRQSTSGATGSGSGPVLQASEINSLPTPF